MNFDPVARPYQWLERITFGGALQTCRTALIHHAKNASNILILGEGDGRFLNELLLVNPEGSVTVVDSSGEMIRLAAERTGRSDRVDFVQADVRDIERLDQQYDLVVTHFFLDCFDRQRVEGIIDETSKKLADNAYWIWSDFSIPESGFWKLPARVIVGVLYWFFRMTTRLEARHLVDPTPVFRKHGFIAIDERRFRGGLLKCGCWQKPA